MIARQWPADAVARLRALWPVATAAEVCAAFPGATWGAIRTHAGRIGLPLGTAGMEGLETISHAAARTGYDAGTLRRLLARQGVALTPQRCPNPRGRREFVEPAAVDGAVALELAEFETVAGAAHRLGIEPCTLRAWLREAGEHAPTRAARRRIPVATIDRVVRARGYFAGGESIQAASRRVGIDQRALAGMLAAHGLVPSKRGARMYLDPAAVDRIVRQSARRAA